MSSGNSLLISFRNRGDADNPNIGITAVRIFKQLTSALYRFFDAAPEHNICSLSVGAPGFEDQGVDRFGMI
jgi:hypothetical protein